MTKLELEILLKKNNVKNLTANSKQVTKDHAFFALKGAKFDGNDFIPEAIDKGAKLIFTNNKNIKQSNIILYVDNIYELLEHGLNIIYPNIPNKLIAVTGTNGKTSVVSYIYQILDYLGYKCAALGTIGLKTNKVINFKLTENLTTYNYIEFREILHKLFLAGINYIALEASSHGLDQNRLGSVKFDCAAITSFSQDHLDYHKNIKHYLTSKLKLFGEHLKDNSEAVINIDSNNSSEIIEFLLKNNIAYCSVGKKSVDIKIKNITQTINHQKISFNYERHAFDFQTNIIGSFQAYNLLIASKLVSNLGIEFRKIINILPKLKAVKGRLDRVTSDDNKFHIFVDYAHTPDALERTLSELNQLKNNGKLYVIFGCGGERDIKKRYIMGEIANNIADYVIITDDNPRNEDPKKIRDQIKEAAPDALIISSRAEAIAKTVKRLKDNDILLIAGKGHEEYQIIGDKVNDFSDFKEVEKNLSLV